MCIGLGTIHSLKHPLRSWTVSPVDKEGLLQFYPEPAQLVKGSRSSDKPALGVLVFASFGQTQALYWLAHKPCF